MYVGSFCQDPNLIPRVVYLTLVKRTGELRDDAQINFSRPRSMKRGTVYRVFIHIDYVENLHFDHYPADELREEGRIPLREFRWQYGHMDGERDDGIVHVPEGMMMTMMQGMNVDQDLKTSSQECQDGLMA